MRQNAGRHLVAVGVLLAGIVLSSTVRGMRPEQMQYQVDLSAIPMRVGEMEGTVLPDDEGVQAYLEADAMKTVAYGEPPETVTLSMIYGASWRTVHTPAQCYPAAGWQVVWERDAIVPVEAELPHEKPVLGRLIRVERDGMAQLVLFVFAHKGGTSIDYTEHSWAVATGPPGAGGLSLMVSASILADEERTQERLTSVAAEVYPRVIAFWYEDWEPPAA